jgi:integrase
LRRAEVAGLRWTDLDLDRGRLSVRRPRVDVEGTIYESEPKTAKGKRTIALDRATVAALQVWQSRQAAEASTIGTRYRTSEFVFTKLDGEPIHPQRLSDWFGQ